MGSVNPVSNKNAPLLVFHEKKTETPGVPRIFLGPGPNGEISREKKIFLKKFIFSLATLEEGSYKNFFV